MEPSELRTVFDAYASSEGGMTQEDCLQAFGVNASQRLVGLSTDFCPGVRAAADKSEPHQAPCERAAMLCTHAAVLCCRAPQSLQFNTRSTTQHASQALLTYEVGGCPA